MQDLRRRGSLYGIPKQIANKKCVWVCVKWAIFDQANMNREQRKINWIFAIYEIDEIYCSGFCCARGNIFQFKRQSFKVSPTRFAISAAVCCYLAEFYSLSRHTWLTFRSALAAWMQSAKKPWMFLHSKSINLFHFHPPSPPKEIYFRR